MTSLDFNGLIDLDKASLTLSLLSITFNPTAWNIVARNGMVFLVQDRTELTRNELEYHNKTITRLFGGNRKAGCYFLAVMIFSFGILRDYLCVSAHSQSKQDYFLTIPCSS